MAQGRTDSGVQIKSREEYLKAARDEKASATFIRKPLHLLKEKLIFDGKYGKPSK